LYGDDADATAHLALYLALGPWVGDSAPQRRIPWEMAINFRSTSEFLADEKGETYLETSNGAINYPLTRYVRGLARTFGKLSSAGGGRDRNGTIDRRLGGECLTIDGTADVEIQVDLPAPGLYEIWLVGGNYDGSFSTAPNTFRIKDNNTAIWEITSSPGSNRGHDLIGSTSDATGLAAALNQERSPVRLLFRTTILKVLVVHQGTTGVINHLRVREVIPSGG
jgi:hypothetical protein